MASTKHLKTADDLLNEDQLSLSSFDPSTVGALATILDGSAARLDIAVPSYSDSNNIPQSYAPYLGTSFDIAHSASGGVLNSTFSNTSLIPESNATAFAFPNPETVTLAGSGLVFV